MAAIFTTQIDEDSKLFQESVSRSALLGLFSLTYPGLVFENKLLEKYSVMEQF